MNVSSEWATYRVLEPPLPGVAIPPRDAAVHSVRSAAFDARYSRELDEYLVRLPGTGGFGCMMKAEVVRDFMRLEGYDELRALYELARFLHTREIRLRPEHHPPAESSVV